VPADDVPTDGGTTPPTTGAAAPTDAGGGGGVRAKAFCCVDGTKIRTTVFPAAPPEFEAGIITPDPEPPLQPPITPAVSTTPKLQANLGRCRENIIAIDVRRCCAYLPGTFRRR
jgi:hypothetical protein